MAQMGPSPPAISLIGATVGNYKVVSKLGEGGMGSVFLAEHPLIGKKVALKVLHPEYASNPEVVGRFFNEARAVNEIGHPNIVDVVDYGTVTRPGERELVYFIMEYLDGESLAEVLKRDAPLPTLRAVNVALQIADALAASHEKGVIHRDLKPDNVFLIDRGRESDFVKVLDFGIAKLSRGPGDLGRTRSGVVMGTPTYMSPEQCEGKRNIDARADVYSLGVMLYEMLTGKVPFTGEGYGEVIMQHITRKPERPTAIRRSIPPAIEAIVLHALEKKRDERFASMEHFIAALREPERFLRDRGSFEGPRSRRATTVPGRRSVVDAHAPTVDQRPTTLGHSAAELRVQRHRSRAPVIVGSAVTVLLLLAGGALLFRSEEREEPTAVHPVPLPPPGPAPAPTPTPVVQPVPIPATVTVTVISRPPGADLIVEGQVRGRTPVSLSVEKADRMLDLALQLDGYKPEVKRVQLLRDAELEVTLEKRTPHARHLRSERPAQPVGEPEPPPAPPPEPAAAAPPPPPPTPEPSAERPKHAPEDDVLPPTFDDE